MAIRPRAPEVGEHDDRELQALGPVDRHDPHRLVLAEIDRRVGRRRLGLELGRGVVDERAQVAPAACLEGVRQAHELAHVRQPPAPAGARDARRCRRRSRAARARAAPRGRPTPPPSRSPRISATCACEPRRRAVGSSRASAPSRSPSAQAQTTSHSRASRRRRSAASSASAFASRAVGGAASVPSSASSSRGLTSTRRWASRSCTSRRVHQPRPWVATAGTPARSNARSYTGIVVPARSSTTMSRGAWPSSRVERRDALGHEPRLGQHARAARRHPGGERRDAADRPPPARPSPPRRSAAPRRAGRRRGSGSVPGLERLVPGVGLAEGGVDELEDLRARAEVRRQRLRAPLRAARRPAQCRSRRRRRAGRRRSTAAGRRRRTRAPGRARRAAPAAARSCPGTRRSSRAGGARGRRRRSPAVRAAGRGRRSRGRRSRARGAPAWRRRTRRRRQRAGGRGRRAPGGRAGRGRPGRAARARRGRPPRRGPDSAGTLALSPQSSSPSACSPSGACSGPPPSSSRQRAIAAAGPSQRVRTRRRRAPGSSRAAARSRASAARLEVGRRGDRHRGGRHPGAAQLVVEAGDDSAQHVVAVCADQMLGLVARELRRRRAQQLGERGVPRLLAQSAQLALVEHDGGRVDSGDDRVGREHARAEAVDRRDPGALHRPRVLDAAECHEALAHAAAQLPGGTARERDRQDRARVEPVVDDVADEALDEDRRLAGSRVRGDHQRPVALQHGDGLLGRQSAALRAERARRRARAACGPGRSRVRAPADRRVAAAARGRRTSVASARGCPARTLLDRRRRERAHRVERGGGLGLVDAVGPDDVGAVWVGIIEQEPARALVLARPDRLVERADDPPPLEQLRAAPARRARPAPALLRLPLRVGLAAARALVVDDDRLVAVDVDAVDAAAQAQPGRDLDGIALVVGRAEGELELGRLEDRVAGRGEAQVAQDVDLESAARSRRAAARSCPAAARARPRREPRRASRSACSRFCGRTRPPRPRSTCSRTRW